MGEEVTVLADYGDLCGEGPLWNPNEGCLYWTDNAGARFYRYDWAQRSHRIVMQGLEINGFALNQPGGFVITNNSGIWLWDGRDRLDLIASEVEGSRCQMNDCIADPEGRLYAGSYFYDPAKEYPLGKLIGVDTDGGPHIVDEGFHISNGLAFSTDARCLYFTDSAARRIYQYDYDRASGNLRNRRVLVAVPDDEGLPDGLTVDAQGYLWSAQWYGGCIVRYDPDGGRSAGFRFPPSRLRPWLLGDPISRTSSSPRPPGLNRCRSCPRAMTRTRDTSAASCTA